jgi:myo-inositol-1(or 4)-monophosphatase
MRKEDAKFWREVSYEIVDKVKGAISPFVGKKRSGEMVKMGADGTPTKWIDMVAEEKVIEVLGNVGRPLTLISEEIGELKIGNDPSEVVFVVDPLDGTSNAVKKIPAYGISIAIADAHDNSPELLTINDVELGFVKNLATGDFYEALKGKKSLINGKDLIPSSKEDISSSSIGAYVYRTKTKKIDRLSKMIRRMRILGSVAIELCYVASGTYDAFMDLRGNLRIVDIAAAKLIVEEAGGVVTDEKGRALNGKLNVKERTDMIAACNMNLHREIMKVMEVV